METLLRKAREQRWINVFIVNLRILIGFAFVPSGLKKLLNQPFTGAGNTGPFHDFLHAFYDTGMFYQFVGAAQLAVAVLLMTQRLATLGALLAIPVIAAITVFCWSTSVVPTAIVATLMLLGVAALVAWDFEKWRSIVRLDPSQSTSAPPTADVGLPIDLRLWQRCGTGILVLYAATCVISGGIYRPRSVELGNPAFYLFPLIALFPIATFAIEHVRRRNAP